MKLWQKIFLWALLTAMLAVSTLGVLLLKKNFKSSMIRQTESTLSVHEYLISNINNRIIAERLRSGSVLLPTKDIANVMKSIFDNSSYYLVMGLKKQAVEDLAMLIDLNDNEKESIKQYSQGEALFVCGNRRMRINVVVTPEELSSFGEGGGL